MTAPDLTALEEAIWARGGEKRGGEIYFLCPKHDDSKPSARWNPEKKTWYCDVCGEGGGYKDLAELMGVELPKGGSFNIIAEYDYTDEKGKLLFQAVRLAPKSFRQRRRDASGKWVWNLKGVRLVVYHLPKVIKAVAAGELVLIVEGEKDVHTLERLGFTATCNPMGAGKWRSSYNAAFKGALVCILADNDKKGEEHAVAVASDLIRVAASVKVVRFPDLPEKGDVTDWVSAGGTHDELLALIAEAEDWCKLNEAVAPKAYTPDIYEFDGGYARNKGKGQTEQLTNWLWEPEVSLVWHDGSLGERGALVVNHTHKQELDLPAQSWGGRRELNTAIGRYGALCLTNSGADIAQIRQHILVNTPELPTAHGLKSYGLFPHEGGYVSLYADETWHGGATPPYFYSGVPAHSNRPKFLAPKRANDQLGAAREAVKAMKGLMSLSSALAIMGYAAAVPYYPRLAGRFAGKMFFLYVEGEKETGKSTFIELALRFSTGSSARMRAAPKMTTYQYDVEVSNANNLLFVLDEYKQGDVDGLEELIRSHHDMEVKQRGTGIAGRLDEYIRNAPMIVNGEGFSTDSATRNRGVVAYPYKRDRGDVDIFNQVRGAPLEALAWVLHNEARTLADDLLEKRLERALALSQGALKTSGSPRLKYALATVAFGLLVLQEQVSQIAFDEANIGFALAELAENTLQGGDEGKTNLELWLEELAYALSTVPANQRDNYVAPAMQPQQLIIRSSPCIELVLKVKSGKAAVRNAAMLSRIARDAAYFEGSDVHYAYPANARVRGVRLDLAKIPARVDAGLLEKFHGELSRGRYEA